MSFKGLTITIRARLLFAFGILGIMLCGIGAAGLNGTSEANGDMGDLYRLHLVPVSRLASINNLMRQNI